MSRGKRVRAHGAVKEEGTCGQRPPVSVQVRDLQSETFVELNPSGYTRYIYVTQTMPHARSSFQTRSIYDPVCLFGSVSYVVGRSTRSSHFVSRFLTDLRVSRAQRVPQEYCISTNKCRTFRRKRWVWFAAETRDSMRAFFSFAICRSPLGLQELALSQPALIGKGHGTRRSTEAFARHRLRLNA